LSGTIGATGQIRNGEIGGGGGENRPGRGHSIKKAEYFEFGFEFIRNAVDHQISVSNRLLDSLGESHERHRFGTQTFSQRLFSMTKAGRHYVFQNDFETSPRRKECETPAEWSSPNNGNGNFGWNQESTSDAKQSRVGESLVHRYILILNAVKDLLFSHLPSDTFTEICIEFLAQDTRVFQIE
jgi:hypothetical protein